VTTTASNFAARAELLTSRNIPTVPVAPGEKKCKLSNWPSLATTDAAQIAKWNTATPDANTAAVCLPDGICVLDADAPELTQLVGSLLPKTFTTRSAGKGLPHYYFLQTDRSRELGNRKSADLFDFQQNRKYVVGPGSVLTDGRTYDVVDAAPIVAIPDALCDWIAANSVSEKRSYLGDKAPTVSEGFDFDDMMEHYGIEGDWNGSVFVTDVCPIAGRKHAQSTETGFLFDGKSLGWKCFAANCEGSSMSVGQVLSHLNKTHKPYPGAIWPQETAQIVGKTIYSDAAEYETALAKQGFRGAKVEGTPFEFVVNPAQGEDDGWFPRGDISLVAGASGSGKTTWVLDLLEKQRRGEQVLGHGTNGLDYLVLLADRGSFALQRTMYRMKIDLDAMPHELIDDGDLVELIDAAVNKHGVPPIVFVEGIDLLGADSNKGQDVAALLKRLHKLVKHYHIAFIGSTGSPKMKPKDSYISIRDQITGTAVWSRKVETVALLQHEQGKETDKVTILSVVPRNAPTEVFQMEFKQGRLRRLDPKLLEQSAATDAQQAFLDWVLARETFTRPEAQRSFRSLSGVALNKRLEGLASAGVIKRRTKGSKTYYTVVDNIPSYARVQDEQGVVVQ
jgi:hypothetical protein